MDCPNRRFRSSAEPARGGRRRRGANDPVVVDGQRQRRVDDATVSSSTILRENDGRDDNAVVARPRRRFCERGVRLTAVIVRRRPAFPQLPRRGIAVVVDAGDAVASRRGEVVTLEAVTTA